MRDKKIISSKSSNFNCNYYCSAISFVVIHEFHLNTMNVDCFCYALLIANGRCEKWLIWSFTSAASQYCWMGSSCYLFIFQFVCLFFLYCLIEKAKLRSILITFETNEDCAFFVIFETLMYAKRTKKAKWEYSKKDTWSEWWTVNTMNMAINTHTYIYAGKYVCVSSNANIQPDRKLTMNLMK